MKKKTNKTLLKRTNPARVVVFLIFLIYAFTMVYALFWGVTASLNNHTDLILDGLSLPKKLNFKNYLEAFQVLETSNAPFLAMLWNSIWLAVGNSLMSLAAVTVTAYVLGQYEFVGKKIIIGAMMVAILVPIYGNGSASLLMLFRLKMYDSPLIILRSASAVGSLTFIVKTFFQNIPQGYREAAEMDGASRMTIFLKVHLPMAKTSLMSIFIMQFIGAWNDYTLPIYYLPSYPTISSGLYVYETLSQYSMNKPIYFAGVVMCAIPPMILFSLFSDKLMTNITMGGLK